MRIIKVGNNKPKEIKKKCSKCKTDFAYESSDVKIDRDGYYVNCPSCNAFLSTTTRS